jgi:hypothetical protein
VIDHTFLFIGDIMDNNSKIVCGFPGVGKSHYALKYGAVDHDSTPYSWSSPGVRNTNFPSNYLTEALQIAENGKVVLVSSHKDVRNWLIVNKISFYIVYPRIDLKYEYLYRYAMRGNTPEFINLIKKNWKTWITEIDEISTPRDMFCTRLILENEEYIENLHSWFFDTTGLKWNGQTWVTNPNYKPSTIK